HRREIRRMNDVRWTTTDDRVVLVLALRGVTLRAALLQTVDFLEPEIPATRTLAKVPTDGSEIANLRRRDRMRRFGESRKTLTHTRVLFEFTQRDERSDREPTPADRDLIQSRNILQIHDAHRPRCVVFHRRQQILTARNRPRRLINITRRRNGEH